MINNKYSLNIEELLDDVNYQEDKDYVPSLFAIHFIQFIGMVNGKGGEENKTPVLHYKILDKIIEDNDILNIIFRGSAKTTLFAEYFILYLAVYNEIPEFGKIKYGIYVGDTIENGVENLYKNIKYRYENSDFLQKMIVNVKWKQTEWYFKNIDGNELIFLGYGARTGIRGTKRFGIRPQIAIIDDIVSDDDAGSPTMVQKIKDTVSAAFEYALHPTKRKIIWSGTPFNQSDPLYEAAESGAYSVNVFPVAELFDETTTEKTFVGAWPDRFPFKTVKAMYLKAKKQGTLPSFYQEMMLRITNKDDLVIASHHIQYVDITTEMMDRMTFYMTTDWAVSQKVKADFSVLSIWGYVDEAFYLVDGFLGRITTDIMFEMIFDFYEKYRFTELAIETSGQQEGFLHMIERMQMDQEKFFKITAIKHPVNVSKFNIILSEVVPRVRRGKLFLNGLAREDDLFKEAYNELSNITYSAVKAKHDDFLDTIVALSSLSPYELGGIAKNTSTSNNEPHISNPFDFIYNDDKRYNTSISSYTV